MEEIKDPQDHNKKEPTTSMHEIQKPHDFKLDRKGMKVLTLIVFIAISGVSAYSIALPYFMKSELKGFYLRGFSVYEVNNETDTVSLMFDFEYFNEYGLFFKLGEQNLILSMQNKSSETWQEIGAITSKQVVLVNITSATHFYGLMNVSNAAADILQRMFVSQILIRSDFNMKITGSVKIQDKENDKLPDLLNMDVEAHSDDIFDYDIPYLGPSTFIVSDLMTPGYDPLQLDKFILGMMCRFRNPLNVDINFTQCQGLILNRTEDGDMGYLTLNDTEMGLIPAKGIKNFTRHLYIPIPAISWLVSDILSNRTGTIRIKNLNGIIKIGNVSFHFWRYLEMEESDAVLTIAISSYRVDGSQLYVDVAVQNGCGLIINVSYLDIDIYVAGTGNKLIWIDKAYKASMDPYSETVFRDIPVDANIPAFLQHVNDLLDLMGTLSGQSYNYQGDIYFESRNLDLIASST